MSPTKPRHRGLVISGIASLIIIGLAIGVLSNRQFLIDQLVVWSYQPTAAVAAIDERAQLSDTGTFYFYASQPEVNQAAEFNRNCPQQETGSAILGCYSTNRIYIYDVNNSELDGIEEVTAAHEMLHAAWDRLSAGEKVRITALLEQELVHQNNTALTERMAYYDRTEPGQGANELHSIIGTEFGDISDELETYYARYFDDRSVIVSLHHGYQNIFDTIKAQGAALLTEINQLAASINSQVQQYNTAVTQLNQDYVTLQARRSSVDTSSARQVNAYNAELNSLRKRQTDLQTDYAVIQRDITTYDQKVTEYNKLIVRSNDLLESIDSTIQATPVQ